MSDKTRVMRRAVRDEGPRIRDLHDGQWKQATVLSARVLPTEVNNVTSRPDEPFVFEQSEEAGTGGGIDRQSLGTTVWESGGLMAPVP